tara:strand:+ start:103176 stop:104249 length:1074 start_codon:yes stop_codon:yes gene_type:complete
MVNFSETGIHDHEKVLDKILQKAGLGSLSNRYQETLRGIDHTGFSVPLNTTKDSQPLFFATRPNFNLSTGNVNRVRLLNLLNTDDEYSLQRYIRCILDPKSHRGHRATEVSSHYANPYDPFIPLMSNSLLTLTGWPDIVLNMFTSNEGIMKESWTMVNGTHEINNAFKLTLNFKNIEGDPLLLMLYVWIIYSSSIKLGDMRPWPRSIINTRIDYQTRFYEFALDPAKRFVTKWADCGAAMPSTLPLGNLFNINRMENDIADRQQLSINFDCQIARYNDPMTINKFNVIQGRFDNRKIIIPESLTPDGKMEVLGEKTLVKMSHSDMALIRHKANPLIHPMTNELQWYITKEEYLKLEE